MKKNLSAEMKANLLSRLKKRVQNSTLEQIEGSFKIELLMLKEALGFKRTVGRPKTDGDRSLERRKTRKNSKIALSSKTMSD